MNDEIILILKTQIAKKFGGPIVKQKDIKVLRENINEVTNATIGFNTLRRFYGRLPSTIPNINTLNILSIYVGFSSFIAFNKHNQKDVMFDNWHRVNAIEIAGEVSELDIIWLTNNTSLDDYFILLSSIIKEFIITRNGKGLYKIYSSEALFEIPRYKRNKIANIAGSWFREYKIEELAILKPLLSLVNFRTNFIYLHVDYQRLNGYYGWMLQHTIPELVNDDEKLFTKLILNLTLFLNSESGCENLYNEKVPENCHPILYGRYWGYQLLHFKGAEFDTVLAAFMQVVDNQKTKVEFFHEVFWILIIIKRIDIIEQIINVHYEELYEKKYWDHNNKINGHLIGQSFMHLKAKEHELANNCLSFIDFENHNVGSNAEYMKLFYTIAKYHYLKLGNGTTEELKFVKDDYISCAESTQFRFFTVSFMEHYFD
jgi:hypothetical protein